MHDDVYRVAFSSPPSFPSLSPYSHEVSLVSHGSAVKKRHALRLLIFLVVAPFSQERCEVSSPSPVATGHSRSH